jgi:hypothetical protein
MRTIYNAIIQKAEIGFLGYQDTLNFDIMVRLNGSSMITVEGHHWLYMPEGWKHHSKLSPMGHVIQKWLEVSGADRVSNMAGKPVRIELDESEVNNTKVLRVGHIVDENWFSTRELMKELYPSQ